MSLQRMLVLLLFLSAAPLRAADENQMPPAEPRASSLGEARGANRPLLLPDIETRCFVGFHPGSLVDNQYSGSIFMLDAWVPIHLVIKNNSKSIFEGTLRCSLFDRRSQDSYAADYQTRVVLAGRGSKKHIMLHAYLPSAALGSRARNVESFRLELQSLSHRVAGLVQPSIGSGKEPVSTSQGPALTNDLVLVLSENLRQLPARPRTGGEIRNRLVQQAAPQCLPRRWIGYSGVSAIIWDGLDMDKVQSQAWQAIVDYVAAGGRLVIAAGENQALLQRQSRLAEILPAAMGQAGHVDLGQRLLGIQGRRAALVTSLSAKPGARAIITDPRDGRPLVVEQDFGAGSVALVAFSLTSDFCRRRSITSPASGADADRVERSWSAWLEPVLHPEPAMLRNLRDQDIRVEAYQFLNNHSIRHVPSSSSMLAFLSIYLIVLVPLTWTICRGWQRLELAWLLMPVIAVSFAFGAYLVAFSRMEKAVSISDISVVRMDESGRGGALTLSLMHNPSYQTYDVGMKLETSAASYYKSRQLPGREDGSRYGISFIEEPDRGIRINELDVDFNTRRPIEAQGVVQIGKGMTARLRDDAESRLVKGNGLGQADNRTGTPLPDMALVCGDHGVLLAPLPGEEGVPLVADSDRMPLPRLCQALAAQANVEKMANVLQAALGLAARGQKRMVLLGVARHGPDRWTIDGNEAEMRAFMVLVHPCRAAAASSIDPPRFEHNLSEEDLYRRRAFGAASW